MCMCINPLLYLYSSIPVYNTHAHTHTYTHTQAVEDLGRSFTKYADKWVRQNQLMLNFVARMTISEEQLLSAHAVCVICDFTRTGRDGTDLRETAEKDTMIQVTDVRVAPLVRIYASNPVIEGQLGPLLIGGALMVGIVIYVVNRDEHDSVFRGTTATPYVDNTALHHTVGVKEIIKNINSGEVLREFAAKHANDFK
jgi:hypothetical protein